MHFEIQRITINPKKYIIWISLLVILVINALFGINRFDPGDLDCFLAAGRAVLNGQNPYNAPSLLYKNVFGSYVGSAINMSPPITLLAYAPLSHFDTNKLFPFWRAISIILFFISLWLLVSFYKPDATKIIWACGIAGLWVSIGVGQIYSFLLLLTVCAWLSLEKKNNLLVGLFIGLLIAIKPNFLVWPVLLFIGGNKKTGISAFFIGILLSLIPFLVWGPSIYYEWLKYSSSAGETFFPTNMSFLGIALRLGIPFLGYLFAFSFLLFVAYWVKLSKPKENDLNGISLLSSLLASPAAWIGYTLLLLPIFFYQKLNRRLLISASLFMIPANLLLAFGSKSKLFLNLMGIIYPLALFLIISVLINKKDKHPQIDQIS
jgi:hypothetical protein